MHASRFNTHAHSCISLQHTYTCTRGGTLPTASLYKKQLAFEGLIFVLINAGVLLLIFYVPPVGLGT